MMKKENEDNEEDTGHRTQDVDDKLWHLKLKDFEEVNAKKENGQKERICYVKCLIT